MQKSYANETSHAPYDKRKYRHVPPTHLVHHHQRENVGGEFYSRWYEAVQVDAAAQVAHPQGQAVVNKTRHKPASVKLLLGLGLHLLLIHSFQLDNIKVSVIVLENEWIICSIYTIYKIYDMHTILHYSQSFNFSSYSYFTSRKIFYSFILTTDIGFLFICSPIFRIA